MEHRRCLGCMNITDQPVCPHCGYPVNAVNEPHQLAAGSVLREQYLVGRVLGQGGFGITYLGWDLDLERIVAIKEFFPSATVNRDINVSQFVRVNTTQMAASFEASRERFLREARALAKLTDIPEIVGIYSSFRENNTAYIVMEFVRGTELAKFVQLRGGRMEAQETLRILKNVIHALDTVHKAGLVHRDISPDNIILHPTGGAKILDFGAVRAVENPDVDKDLNKSTEAIVKHGFAPVEQYRNRGGIGPWTDEYALCGTIYYCLTGRVPPDAVSRSMGEEHPDWQSIPGLTDRQRAALEKGMSVLARDRFPSVAELEQELYAEEAPALHPEPAPVFTPTPQPKPAFVFTPAPQPEPAPVSAPAPQPESAPVSAPAPQPEPAPVSAPAPQPNLSVPPKRKKKLSGLLIGLIAGGAAVVAAIAAVVIFFLDSGTVLTPFVSGEGSRIIGWNPMTVEEQHTVESVTFLDTLEDAPLLAKDVSYNGDKSVLKWREGDDIYIAAQGTIDAANNCWDMFNGCYALETVTFGGCLDTSSANDFSYMFKNCSSLTDVDLETLDVSYGHTFINMFYNCSSLTSLDVANWDMSRAQTLRGMFEGCSSLTEIPVSKWDTSSARDMSSMFANCPRVTRFDCTDWNVSNVTAIAYMFQGCSDQAEIFAPEWNFAILEQYEGYLDDIWNIGGIPWEEWFLQNT